MEDYKIAKKHINALRKLFENAPPYIREQCLPEVELLETFMGMRRAGILHTNKKRESQTSERLREIMALKRLRVADIAEGTGIPANTIYAYIVGRYTPRNDKIKIIANYLNISELWLLGCDVAMKRATDTNTINEKVYIVANTLRHDFRLHTATTDKELAESVYAQLKKSYLGTEFEDDLKILEFGYVNSQELLNGRLYDITEKSLRSPLIKDYPYNLLVALAEKSPDTVSIPTDRISPDIEEGLEYALSTLSDRKSVV